MPANRTTNTNPHREPASGVTRDVEQIVLRMARAPDREVSADTRLVEDLGYTSLRLFELTIVLEQRFQIPLPPEETMDISTLGEVRTLVARLLDQQV